MHTLRAVRRSTCCISMGNALELTHLASPGPTGASLLSPFQKFLPHPSLCVRGALPAALIAPLLHKSEATTRAAR